MNCENCGTEFDGKKNKLFCSEKCKVENYRKSVTVSTETVLNVTDVVTVSTKPVLNVTENPEVGTGPLREVDQMKPLVPKPSYMNLEKDLKLSPEKDLGILGWTPDGIFIKDDISISQVRRIRSLVEAKHNWPHRTYEDSGIKMVGNI
jgi:hypothetical protein